MKAVFIAYNQAYNDEIVDLLYSLGQRGFTEWREIGGRGSVDGEPHRGRMPTTPNLGSGRTSYQ